MTVEGWVLAADARRLGAMVSAVRGIGGRVTVVAIGPRPVAEAAAAAGPDAVKWIEVAEDVPAEAYGARAGVGPCRRPSHALCSRPQPPRAACCWEPRLLCSARS